MMTDSGSGAQVTPAQRAKLAYVYIRQSSLSQVLQNTESTELQYQLMTRATRLGWPAERVQVIDEDLGKSGASADQRRGFQFLIAEVGLGRVGLVISLDASRLARNNSDWYRLIDLCSLFGTLIADSERIYDPSSYHDRLILGLSGMMSEAELHQLKRRLQTGARHKAERGELRLPLPVGLVRRPDGAVIFNPDEEVQARLRLIFAKFAELRNAMAVRNYLRRERLPIPARPPHGPAPYETVWQPPRESMILRILHNPAYAGTYAYGQYRVDPTRPQPGDRPGQGPIVRLPPAQWWVCLHHIYPAYITWETYLANLAQLQANRSLPKPDRPGAARHGAALLQGLVRCARCGRRMRLHYSGPQGNYPVYGCRVDAKEYGGTGCQHVRALGLETAVEQEVLAALAPDRIAMALAALEQWELEVQTLERQWQLRLERVRYEAHRAQRQFNVVDPENRLVARTLERQWEDTLRAVESTEQAYAAFQREHHTDITAQDRQEIVAIGEDLPRLWRAASTTAVDRKQIVRWLIQDVLVDQKRLPGRLWFQLNWQTGASTVHDIPRRWVRYEETGDGERLQARIQQLRAARQADAQAAVILNAEGYRTTRGQLFTASRVWYLRQRWGVPSVNLGDIQPDGLRWKDGAYTLRGVVQALSITPSRAHRWLRRGLLQGTHLGPHMLWRIPLTTDQVHGLREYAYQTRGPGPHPNPEPAGRANG